MLSRLSAARLLLPTVMTFVSLAVLVTLGTWQMSRKSWKDGLVAQIGEKLRADPVGLEAAMSLYSAAPAGGTGEALEYKRVRVTGRFLHDREQYLYAPHPKLGPGYHVITPMAVAAPVARTVLVNRGYVPESSKDRTRRQAGLPAGERTITGLVRLSGEKGGFTPPNDPAANLWYWRDVPALARAAIPGEERFAVPFLLDAEREPANPGGWPLGGTTEIKLPNRHLEYALTWYGLAGALIAVYFVYAWGRLRPRPSA